MDAAVITKLISRFLCEKPLHLTLVINLRSIYEHTAALQFR